MAAGAAPPKAGPYTNTGVGGSSGRTGAPQNSCSDRFSAAIDRLLALSRRNMNDSAESRSLCIYLSRVIDFAIWNHEVPIRSQELPSLIKKLYESKNDNHLLAAIMVLMISVNSACQNRWFSDGDTKVLSYLAKEITSNFCSESDFITEPSSSFSVISTIISRFYPLIKIGHIFVSLEVKPGSDTYVSDFQISNNLKPSPRDTLRLFVIQTNSIETSSCLITPPKVVFLLNGMGVQNRSYPFVDTGPQPPTIVSNMLRCGSNLLQAVGEFNGNYIIAVASTSGLPGPDSNTLQDYEQCSPANVEADSEVTEGSSRIQLNCPISLKRIKIPVKGQSCKHIQCFDFDNYVDINSRRPSWRCPHCNQHVCFPDIRIDRKMVKVLQEVGPNVSDVMFFADGSWNAVTESEDANHNSEDNTGHNDSRQPANVLDLTETDDAMDAVPTYEDGKHSSTAHETQMSNSNHDYWSELLISTFGMGSSNIQPSELTAGGSLTSSALMTDSFTPDRLLDAINQFGNPSMSNEFGRFPPIPGNITRIIPTQAPSAHQWSSTNDPNSFMHIGPSSASQTSPAASNLTATRGTPRQQNFAFPPDRQPHPIQNAGFLDPNQVPNLYRVSNASTQQQMGNFRLNRAMSQSSSQPSSSFSHPHRTGVANVPQSQLIAEANRAVQMSIDASRTVPSWYPTAPTPVGDQRGISGAASQQPVNYDAADPNWRPAVRMRGALSGQAYADALYQNIVRPNSQAQAARPMPSRPPQVQALMASGPILGYPVLNSASVPIGQPMGSHVLPEGSSRMH
ncbi:hypothetical protein ACS0TY_012661 [Phlomoides rotata]